MSGYYDATICKNGHTLSAYEEIPGLFCHKCGAESITCCPNCQTNIRGEICTNIPMVGYPYKPPAYCFKCGKPFPWTTQALDVAKELIDDDDNLDALSKEKLTDLLPDLLVETPKSNLAASRLKKALMVAGKFTAEGLRQFAIDFGCELAKKQLGL